MYLDKGVLPTLPHGIAPKDNEKEPTQAGPDIDRETRVKATESDFLRILHVTRPFSANVAVGDVSLGLGEGEILTLLGPNGASKTTIVNMVREELRPALASFAFAGSWPSYSKSPLDVTDVVLQAHHYRTLVSATTPRPVDLQPEPNLLHAEQSIEIS